MLFAIVFMSAIFGIIGLSVTKSNARYLLSGYNTMSEEERANVDIDRYIPYFRKFHLYLAGSFLILGSLLNFFNVSSAGFFLIFFPLSAYTYFIFKSQKFYKGNRKHRILVPIIIFLVVMIFVASFFLMGLREDILIIKGETLELSGYYGETIQKSEIQKIELRQNLPELVMKTNGFAIGNIKKGYFKTSGGEIVKLLIHSDYIPVIEITRKDGNRIFYSAQSSLNEDVFNEIKERFLIEK